MPKAVDPSAGERVAPDPREGWTPSLSNAIQLGDNFYMLPKGIDEDGCEIFGPYSKGGMTVTALYHRQADGGFDIAKDPAICRVEMISIGAEVAGCEMYRAEPVNRDLDALDITYMRSADGRYVVYRAKADCGD